MKTSQELFLQANQQYSKKEYESALRLYEKISHKSAAVWHNMGNCAYKLGDDLHAFLYWQRATKLDNSIVGKSSEFNSKVVAEKLQITPISKHFYHIRPLPLQILFFFTFIVFLISNHLLWRAKRFISLSFMSVFVIGLGMLTYASHIHFKKEYAIVMEDESKIYAGPGCDYHELADLPKGNKILVCAHKNGWKKVSWSGYKGWIETKKIEMI